MAEAIPVFLLHSNLKAENSIDLAITVKTTRLMSYRYRSKIYLIVYLGNSIKAGGKDVAIGWFMKAIVNINE
jgi:hypothetical protein